ncbi:MAG TPA: bifunctional 3,4-dihydroxy-2-butanone-4-phosphate synthase/GTP cyclohydrolase II [Casimicrobium sp.]|nr:bifunctional 3,4-dihydroxy-2-butanone-4-phosphate synthase/GTP cyclohydrolase II [Casimicrobium sp.]
MATSANPASSSSKPALAAVPSHTTSVLSSVPEIIADLKAGRMVILVDEEDRENEGDLVLAAEFVTPDAINFMAKHGRGLICLTLTQERCAQLNIPLMTSSNRSGFGTNFTQSIEAAEGVTSGISAADRAHTVKTAVAFNAKPSDIVQPGHIFPIMAQPGGVLMRAGHTEAGCDLTRMAGLTPAAVICEVMKDDGTMARLPDLLVFAKDHNLKIGAITDLIQFRAAQENLVECVGERPLHTAQGEFTLKVFREKLTAATHLAIVKGTPTPDAETVVRVHEPLSVIDMLDAASAVHSWSVPKALERLQRADAGVLVLLHQTESADDLRDRALNVKPLNAHKMDLRTYGIGAQILRALCVGKMRVLAKPRRMPSMTGFDLEVVAYEER